jgi:hypothetical protein
VELGKRSERGTRTRRELLFAVGDEMQSGGADGGAGIGDPDEDDFVSSGLKFAG